MRRRLCQWIGHKRVPVWHDRPIPWSVTVVNKHGHERVVNGNLVHRTAVGIVCLRCGETW